jgi:hypothetical protein
MNNRAIVLKGRAKSGKTHTIVKVYELLKSKYKDAEIQILSNIIEMDKTVILKIKGKKIGIESQGDPPGKRLKASLDLFIEKKCTVIVCDTRTWGKTVNIVNNLENSGFTIKWFKQKYWTQTPKRDTNNLEMAKIIVREIETAIEV